MTNNTRRPWFGSKRIGYGIRPQTWQGWLVILVPTIVIIALVVWLRMH
jgi:hypothetical protein